MPLTAGTRLGPYQIVSPLGAGGMGEVYRARDPRLDRDVAIKVLPASLSSSPEVRARFEREAKTISSLNHPHICTLFDVGREGDTDYLVMELVDGETLAQRLAGGPMAPSEVLRIGIAIADALDRAHRAGVVHRDLKPGNVMLTKSGVKLMDFGLARVTGLAGPARGSGVTVAALTQSPTIAAPLTTEGSIVGTFQYMAPEQLEGKDADARSDIWSLGCVLYEMATGRRAFDGKSQASLIGAIMTSEPAAISQVAPLSPPGLDRLARACLAKDPDDRIQTAHDVKLQLQWIAEGGSQAGVPAPVAARRRGRERMAWALVAALALVAGALAALQLRPKPAAKPVIFELTAPRQVTGIDLPRIAPDGRRLAFNATDSTGATAIWVRLMNSLDAQRLPGTEGATRPFWSPDSRYLAFFSGGKLRKIDVAGGPPQALCDVARGADGSWSSSGVILFDGTSADSVQRVAANGGTPAPATYVDRAKHETFTAWPQFLPDGRHFLYVAYGATVDDRTLRVGTLDSKESKSLGPAGSRVEYVPGYLLFVRQGTLLAQRFDARALKTVGDPVPLASGVETDAVGSARFSASSEGTLVYRSGNASARQRLTWVDRSGAPVGTVGGSGIYDSPALSHDGTQLAVKVIDPARNAGDIWIWDLARDVGSRFTSEATDVDAPVWSPDDARLLYCKAQANANDFYVRPVDGSGGETLVYRSPLRKFVSDWSPDGRTLAYIQRGGEQKGSWDAYTLSIGDSVRAAPFVAGAFQEFSGTFSPDGRWLAYTSLESGQIEVYVQAFPGPGGRRRVSTAGGQEPYWRADGREMYYLSPDRHLMAVDVEAGTPPRFGLPKTLFTANVSVDVNTRNRYLPTRDGKRFLLVSPEGAQGVGATTVVLDWPGTLSKP